MDADCLVVESFLKLTRDHVQFSSDVVNECIKKKLEVNP